MDLNGKYFTARVKKGEAVKVGDPLIDFDRDKLLEEGYDITVPVVLPDLDQKRRVLKSEDKRTEQGNLLLTVCE